MKYITVLDISDLTLNLENLPYYLLKVLFKFKQEEALSKHDQLTKDLQLILDWNCPEIALTNVFYKDPTFKVNDDIFEEAFLKEGCEEFVSLFLDNGFQVHKYLDANRLIKLFRHSLKGNFFFEVCVEGVLGYRKEIKLNRAFIDGDLNWIIEKLTGVSIIIKAEELDNASKELFDKTLSKDISIDFAKQKALKILLIWALLSKRHELALVLWQHTGHPVVTALTSSLILDKMKPLINDRKTKEDVDDISRKFASMAVGVFDLCYNDLPSLAYSSLSDKTKEWAGLSLIDFSYLSQNRTLVAHPCCQKWLTNKFMGNLKLRELSWGFVNFPVYIKVILCAFFVFPMYLWIGFKEASTDKYIELDEFDDPYYEDSYVFDSEDKRKLPKEAERAQLTGYQHHDPPIWKMIYYLWCAPITKFWVSIIFYVLFLITFSLAVLWPSCGNVYLDSIVCIWTLLIAVDCIYQLYSLHEAFPNTPLFGSSLEVVYMLFFVFFYFMLRVVNAEGFRDPYTGKILICLGLLYFYYRMIFIYLPISSTLGPLLYRVKTMITVDFINFMKLVMFILMGNAIAMQAILYPDYPLIPELIRKSFHKAIIIFFLTPVSELTEKNSDCVTWEQKPASESMCRISQYVDGECSDGIHFWPYILVFHFVLLMKLVLMTVLFALFQVTGARLAAQSDSIWKFQRYKLIINFSSSLRLPPPLNIFSVLIIVCRLIINCCKKCVSCFKRKEADELEEMTGSKDEKFLPTQNYRYWRQLDRYWRQLAVDYYTSKNKEKEENAYVKKESDILFQFGENLKKNDILIYQAIAQIKQLESDFGFTHARLETLKYRTKKEDTKEITLHTLSRESPYPNTKIQRFLVPDKYVPWEVTLLHYDPIFYTMPKDEFSKFYQPYVDDNIRKAVRKKDKIDMSVFKWNLEAVDATGYYRNRKSWITGCNCFPITYKLDKFDLPRNPMGRTGLRGKGALPRWGPNHYVYSIITRWKKSAEFSEENLMEKSDYLEYVETWLMNKTQISLPGGPSWHEKKYESIQTCFLMDENTEPWVNADDMIAFFKSCAVSLSSSDSTTEKEITDEEFTSRQVCLGYMDDQLNTDHAWKEVELWHFHYNVWNNLRRKFKANIRWKTLSEDVFIQLPYGQTELLQDAIKHLKARIATS